MSPPISPRTPRTSERKLETPEPEALTRTKEAAARTFGGVRRNLESDFQRLDIDLSLPPMDLQSELPFASSTPENKNLRDIELEKAIDEKNREATLMAIAGYNRVIFHPNENLKKVVELKWESEALLLAVQTADLFDQSVVTACIHHEWHSVIEVLLIRTPYLYKHLDAFIKESSGCENQQIRMFFEKAKEQKYDKSVQFSQYIEESDWENLDRYLEDQENPILDPNHNCAIAIRAFQPQIAAKIAVHTSSFKDIEAIRMAIREGYNELVEILFEKNPEMQGLPEIFLSSIDDHYDSEMEFEKTSHLERAQQLFGATNDADAAFKVLTEEQILNLDELKETARNLFWQQTLEALRQYEHEYFP